jgi:hypothetical protein
MLVMEVRSVAGPWPAYVCPVTHAAKSRGAQYSPQPPGGALQQPHIAYLLAGLG